MHHAVHYTNSILKGYIHNILYHNHSYLYTDVTEPHSSPACKHCVYLTHNYMSNLHVWHFLVMFVSYWYTEDLASSTKSIITNRFARMESG